MRWPPTEQPRPARKYSACSAACLSRRRRVRLVTAPQKARIRLSQPRPTSPTRSPRHVRKITLSEPFTLRVSGSNNVSVHRDGGLWRHPMTRRDIEFDAEGVTLRLSAAEATGALVRPLGVFERMYHRYQQRSTMHFCVVAEPADDLDPSAPDVGLLAVQRRHPLLNVFTALRPCRRSRSRSSTPGRAA